MANNPSFTLSGPTPQQPNVFGGQMGGSTTPVSKALNAASTPYQQLTNNPVNFNVGTKQPNPTTPLKSQTVTNVDGSSTKSDYHAPAQNNASTGGTPGLVNPNANWQQNVGGAQGTPVSFPGLVGSLANSSQQGSQQGKDITGQLQNISNQGSSGVLNATNNLRNLQDQYASEINRVAGLPIGAADQAGRDANLNLLYSSKVSNAQTALQNALQGQSQQITGLTSAGGLANTQQGLIQSGMTSAGQLAQPQLGAYGQAYYQPLQAGQQQGGNYGTGPAAAANVASVQEQTKLVNDWSAARQSANNIGNQLQTFLQTNQINPADFNAVNKFLQAIGAQTSSPQYKQFYNLVTDLANTYAPVLSTSGDATNYKTQLAQSLLDGTASGKTIPQILQGLDQQAQAKIAGIQSNIQNLNTGGQVNPTILSGPSTGGGIWSW